MVNQTIMENQNTVRKFRDTDYLMIFLAILKSQSFVRKNLVKNLLQNPIPPKVVNQVQSTGMSIQKTIMMMMMITSINLDRIEKVTEIDHFSLKQVL